MKSINRIKSKVKYSIDNDVIEEVISFYGEVFDESKDDEILDFIDNYYSEEISNETTLKDYIMSFLIFLIVNFVLSSILLYLFSADITIFTSNLLYLSAIAQSIIAMLIYIYFAYFVYNKKNENVNIKELKKSVKKQIIIIFCFAISLGIIVFYTSNYISAIYTTTGILNAVWGMLLGFKFIFK